MKHLFASGEIIYGKNKKSLEQGVFAAEYIEYDDINEDTEFVSYGDIDGRSAQVKFKINRESYSTINFRYTVKILMRSDLLQADWDFYEIKYEQ